MLQRALFSSPGELMPTRIQAAGNKPKLIDEYVGRVNTKTASTSIAHLRSPQGWEEPGRLRSSTNSPLC
jgi:hypothetical protein